MSDDPTKVPDKTLPSRGAPGPEAAQPARAREDSDPLAGTPYRIVRRIGGGAAGDVVEAQHVPLARNVVVKLLRDRHAGRPDLIDRMRIEAQSLARLSHPNVVAVSDFGQSRSGRTFIVMEHLKGRDLRAEIDERGDLPVLEAVDFVRQALAGLAAAHAIGIVHRDVKPENLFLTRDREGRRSVKVIDFGIAKVRTDTPGASNAIVPLLVPTGPLALIGTMRYMAPEQIRGEAVDGRTDVYAAGLVLYRLIAGRGPFDDRKLLTDLARAHISDAPDPPSRHARQRIAPELDAAVLRAIAKRPEERFATVEAFRDELGRVAWMAGPARDSNALAGAGVTAMVAERRTELTTLGDSTREPTAAIAIPDADVTAVPPTATPPTTVPLQAPIVPPDAVPPPIAMRTAPHAAAGTRRGAAADPRPRLLARVRWVAGATALGSVLWGMGMASFDVALWVANEKPTFEDLYRQDAIAEIVYQSIHTAPYLVLAWITWHIPSTGRLALAPMKRWVPIALGCVALGFMADAAAFAVARRNTFPDAINVLDIVAMVWIVICAAARTITPIALLRWTRRLEREHRLLL